MTPARCLQNTPDQINSSNSTIRRRFGSSHWPSRKRRVCELRGGAVNARRPRRRRGRSEAKSIDGAEHSSRIERVMASGSFPPTFGDVCATKSGRFLGAISARTWRRDREANPRGTRPGSRDVSDPRRRTLGPTSRVRWGVAHVPAAVLSAALRAAENAARPVAAADSVGRATSAGARFSARLISDAYGRWRRLSTDNRLGPWVTLAPPLNVTLNVTLSGRSSGADQGRDSEEIRQNITRQSAAYNV